jgi:RNA 2',3'-cyclic 3'-phosphodiesterase
VTQQRAEQLRLFVACALPDDVLRGLSSLQDALRRKTEVRLRWVRPEGIHMTLKFLGSVDAGRVGEIEAALAAAIDPFEACLRPAALGGFGGSRIRVVWVGLEGDVPGLVSLANRVEGALAPLGFPREERPFAPHLTLARVPDEASSEDGARLAKLVAEHGLPPLPELTLTEVHLMRSILGRGGAVYERLVTLPQPEG